MSSCVRKYLDLEIESIRNVLINNKCQAPPGNRGIKGETGAKGEIGDIGSSGVNGIKGDKGANGNQGIKGSQGTIGVKGLSGDKGIKGDTGDIGNSGPQGVKGEKGNMGDKGLPGDCDCQSNCASIASNDINKGDIIRLENKGNIANVRTVVTDASFIWTNGNITPVNPSSINIRGVTCNCQGDIFVFGINFQPADFIVNGVLQTIPPGAFLGVMRAENPTEWANILDETQIQIGIPGFDFIRDIFGIITDCQGRVYIIFTRPENSVLARYNADLSLSAFRQTTTIEDGDSLLSGNVRVDANGDVYAFLNITNSGTNTGFVRRYDSALLFQEQSTITSSLNETILITDMVVDCLGGVYVTGVLSGTIEFGSPAQIILVPTINSPRIYLARLDSRGAGMEWTSALQSESPVSLGPESRLTNDNLGNIYLTNTFTGTLEISGVSIGEYSTTASINDRTLIVLRFSLGLILQSWTVGRVAYFPGVDLTMTTPSITSDIRGNVYLSGIFEVDAVFNQQLMNQQSFSRYVVALHRDRWRSALQISSQDAAITPRGVLPNQFMITADGQGNIYVASNFGNVATLNNLTRSVSGVAFLVTQIVSDRTIRLLGIAPNDAITGDAINPIFNAQSTGDVAVNLISGYGYYVNNNGELVSGCPCRLCGDALLTYTSTACNRNSLIWNPGNLSK